MTRGNIEGNIEEILRGHLKVVQLEACAENVRNRLKRSGGMFWLSIPVPSRATHRLSGDASRAAINEKVKTTTRRLPRPLRRALQVETEPPASEKRNPKEMTVSCYLPPVSIDSQEQVKTRRAPLVSALFPEICPKSLAHLAFSLTDLSILTRVF